MPAHAKYGSPFENLLRILSEARARGDSFDTAWSLALGAPSVRGKGVPLPHQTLQRAVWLNAFAASKEEWRASYEGRETRLSRALERLSEVVIEDSSSAARLGSLLGVTREETPELARVPVVPVSGLTRKGLKAGRAEDWPETRELAA